MKINCNFFDHLQSVALLKKKFHQNRHLQKKNFRQFAYCANLRTHIFSGVSRIMITHMSTLNVGEEAQSKLKIGTLNG